MTFMTKQNLHLALRLCILWCKNCVGKIPESYELKPIVNIMPSAVSCADLETGADHESASGCVRCPHTSDASDGVYRKALEKRQ